MSDLQVQFVSKVQEICLTCMHEISFLALLVFHHHDDDGDDDYDDNVDDEISIENCGPVGMRLSKKHQGEISVINIMYL